MVRRSLHAMAFLCSAVAGASGVQAAAQPEGGNGLASPGTVNSGLADIVVTARKRAEAAQSVPVSVSAFNAAMLEGKHVVAINDLALHTSGLTLQSSTSPQIVTVQIRGQNTQQTSLNLDPAIGIYVDGVYIGPDVGNAIALNFDDAASAEVLKGPQGTLYGRNTTGGAIKLDHVIPDYKTSGWVKAGLANYDGRLVSGAVTLPLIDQLATLRVYGRYTSHDGYGFNSVLKEDLEDDSQYNFSAALRLDPASGLRILFRGAYDHDRAGNVPLRPVAVSAGSGNSTTLIGLAVAAQHGLPIEATPGSPYGFTLTPEIAREAEAIFNAGIAPGFYDMNSTLSTPTSFRGYNGSATIDYEVSPGLQFKSITAYRNINSKRLSDLVGSSAVIGYLADQPLTYHQFTEEVTANGAVLDDKLKYTLGAFYLQSSGRDTSIASTTPILGAVLGATSPVPTGLTYEVGDQRDKSVALYGQATYEILPKLNLTAGVRWTDEKKDLTPRNRFAVATFDPTTSTLTPLPPVLNSTVFCSEPNQGIGDDCYGAQNTSFKKVTFLASLDYKIAHNTLIYAKFSRGFRSGGGQIYSGGFGPPFAPETVDDYEVGIKADWFGRTLRTNLALYYDNYSNIQKTQYLYVNNTESSVVVNAAQARIQGAEFDITLVPARGLNLGFSGAYTDPKYKDYVNNGVDSSQNKFQGIAKFTWTLSGGYKIPVSLGDMELNVDYWHTSSVPLAPDAGYDGHGNAPWDTQKPYGLLSARLALELQRPKLTISAWGKNLLAQKYFNYSFDLINSLGYASSFGNEPRTWGVEVEYRF